MNKILNYFGLRYEHLQVGPCNYESQDYGRTGEIDMELAQTHRDFLKSLEDDEVKRLDLLEAKTSQMVSQTGIVFSLLSLFVPLLIEKAENLTMWIKIFFSLLLTLSFVFYILAIRNALKNFDVKNFIYSKPSPENVLKYQDKTKSDFLAIEVRDLLYCINQNTVTNNKKATNLIHSYNSFMAGNLVVAVLVVSFCVSFLIFSIGKRETNELQVIRIESIDSLGKNVVSQLKGNFNRRELDSYMVKASASPVIDSTKRK